MAGVGTGLAASVADCVVEADAVDQRSDGVTSARAKKHAADKINPRFLITPPKITTISFGASILRPFAAERFAVVQSTSSHRRERAPRHAVWSRREGAAAYDLKHSLQRTGGEQSS
jgi:hypothetical protein